MATHEAKKHRRELIEKAAKASGRSESVVKHRSTTELRQLSKGQEPSSTRKTPKSLRRAYIVNG